MFYLLPAFSLLLSVTAMDMSGETDAEDPDEASASPEGCSTKQDPNATQHKTVEGPLEGTANLTFTVPILKVST